MAFDGSVPDLTHLADIEALRQVKACYFRGVDTSDHDLIRSILAEDCVLDYMGCFTDPQTGEDFFPMLNVVMRGRKSWAGEGGVASMGIVSVHQGYHHEIIVTGPTTAEAIWSMTDRMFMPAGHTYRRLEGFGNYHDTYEKVDGRWYLKTTRLQRLKVVGII